MWHIHAPAKEFPQLSRWSPRLPAGKKNGMATPITLMPSSEKSDRSWKASSPIAMVARQGFTTKRRTVLSSNVACTAPVPEALAVVYALRRCCAVCVAFSLGFGISPDPKHSNWPPCVRIGYAAAAHGAPCDLPPAFCWFGPPSRLVWRCAGMRKRAHWSW